MNQQQTYDVIISGAGPAGAVTSLYLSQMNIRHLLLDKDKFPRDKICGDAVSGKVLEILHELDEKRLSNFVSKADQAVITEGIRFVAPNGNGIDIPFPSPKNGQPIGLVSKRLDFDNFLAGWAASEEEANLVSKAPVTSVERSNTGITLEAGGEKYSTKLLIGADGHRSAVRRAFFPQKEEQEHLCAGIRVYYSGIEDLLPGNFLELHFIKEFLPGYLWIFPLSNGMANVGIGMLSSKVQQNKVNLRNSLEDLIQNHPRLKSRFAHARKVGPVKGWGLPLGSKKRVLHGDHFMLTGDAASLIDPFTGEGIGNAAVSGKLAAQFAAQALEQADYSSQFLSQYEHQVYQKLWKELQLSHRLQRLSSFPPLFNFVVNKVQGSRTLQDVFTNMFTDLELRSQMKNPLFYFRLLFN